MTDLTPAYAYGRFLGEFRRGMLAVLTEMGRGFQDALNTTRESYMLASSPEADEVHAENLYRLRIARERRIGLQHVHDQAQRVRRELGLPTETIHQRARSRR